MTTERDDGGPAGPRSFEDDLIATQADRVRDDEGYARRLWSSLANVDWWHPETNSEGGYSFRAAGAVIAEMRGEGDYMDWYCCGPYAVVDDEVRRRLRKLGWIYCDTPEICDEPDCLEDVTCGWPSPNGYRNTCGKHAQFFKARE